MKKLSICLSFILFFAYPLYAEIIVFDDGTRLKVKEYRINGDQIECYILGSWQSYPFNSVKNIESGKGKPHKKPPHQKTEKKEMVHLIILKDGQTIIAKDIWDETNEIQYMKYGSMVSIKKELIHETKWVEKEEAMAHKDNKIEQNFKEKSDEKNPADDSMKRLAHESNVRALKRAGSPARFVKVGMTKQEVFELAGDPTTRSNDFAAYSKCKEVYNEIWNYKYGRWTWYAIYFSDQIVVCSPDRSGSEKKYNPVNGRRKGGIYWVTPTP